MAGPSRVESGQPVRFLAGCQAQEPYVLVRSVREFRRPVTRELIATSGVTGHRRLRRPL